MMQREFEALAGITVTAADYDNIIEPMYMATGLDKQEFIKTLNLKFFKNRVPKAPKNIKKMLVRDRSGYTKTPNGCYYHIQYVELVGTDIATGKFIIKALEEADYKALAEKGHDLNLGYDFDMDYIQCVDTKKKPIKLFWFE